MVDKILKVLLFSTQNGLLKALPNTLRKYYEDVEATNDYIIAKGNEVGVIAHLDTVHKRPPTENSLYYDKKKNTLWSPDGLGADDRAGIYIILKLISSGARPTVIFTTNEEVGALGAQALITAHPDNYLNLKYLIELDRQGAQDCVFYRCRNSKFELFVESYGFRTTWGTFSDISIIAPKWGIAAVNLSVGYFDEHSCAERLNLTYLHNTLERVEQMIADIDHTPSFEFAGEIDLNIYNQQCAMCASYVREDEVFPVRGTTGTLQNLCIDCYCSLSKYIEWCDICNCAYLDYLKGGCPHCTKK